ncbi:hypothetical protein FRC11_000394, partial [Ceratobasidium sp. 423]
MPVSSLPPPEPVITKSQATRTKKSQAMMYIGTNKCQAPEELEITRKCLHIEPTGQKVPLGDIQKKPRKSVSLVILPSSNNRASGSGSQCTTSSQPPPAKAKLTKPLASGNRLPPQALADQSQSKGAVAPCHRSEVNVALQALVATQCKDPSDGAQAPKPVDQPSKAPIQCPKGSLPQKKSSQPASTTSQLPCQTPPSKQARKPGRPQNPPSNSTAHGSMPSHLGPPHSSGTLSTGQQMREGDNTKAREDSVEQDNSNNQAGDTEVPEKGKQVTAYTYLCTSNLITNPTQSSGHGHLKHYEGVERAVLKYAGFAYQVIMLVEGMYDTNILVLEQHHHKAWHMGCDKYEADPVDLPLTDSHIQSLNDRLVSWHGHMMKNIADHVTYLFFGVKSKKLTEKPMDAYIDKLKDGYLHTK